MKEQCFNFQYLLPDDTQLQAAFKQFGKEFPHIKIKNCEVYLCQFENQSTVGDLRVSFQYVLCGNTTIISKQINNTFVPYVIEDQYQSEKSLHSDEFDSDQGCCTDSWTSKIAQFAKSAEKPIQQLSWITEDIQSSEQLFNQYFIRNSDLTYSTRIKSFSIMVFGITIILEGFFNLGLPRDIQFFIFVGIGMIFSIPVSLIIALLAWMRYHLFYTLINCLGLAIVFSLVALLLGGIFY
ncbi:unnamed protein product [Paramecium sonneborni]|uniref:Uncharacterized protein n=1 Tax=Paramecium sonneborni TaxID=65129 RepID=A0A8S1QPM7_9CILI|nr:unnamed protein product [Paramecium sonneborni]